MARLTVAELQRRLQEDVIILDGGFATQLEASGCDISGKLWSAAVLLTQPEAAQEAHEAYLLAGADVIITSSYQLTIEGVMEEGMSRERAVAALAQSVAVAAKAREAVRGKVGERRYEQLIAASIGPYGAYKADGSEYTGRYGSMGVEELTAFHKERLMLLAGQPATDILALETIPNIEEAIALCHLVAEVPHVPTWLSLQAHGGCMADGTPLMAASKALAGVLPPNIVAVGVNCCPPEGVAADLVLLGRHLPAGVCGVAYANSGEKWDAEARAWRDGAATAMKGIAAYVRMAEQWVAGGVRLLGGCCRTTPGHVRALRKMRDE